MSKSTTTKVLKWGTIGTWMLGSSAAKIIVPILMALVIFVGIVISTADNLHGWVKCGVDAGNAATTGDTAPSAAPDPNCQ